MCMNVVMVASECAPFYKTGGLADVIGSLPQALAKQGHQVSVFLPKFARMPHTITEQFEWINSFSVSVTWRSQHCAILTYKKDQVTYYFIENDYYFDRVPFYGQADDAERFAYFTHAVLEAIERLELAPDIIHCHDWQTGLIPSYVKTGVTNLHTPTVYTIHNLRYQGVFPHSIFDELLHLGYEHRSGLDHDGVINFMKAAVVHADQLTTVSPTYAREIQTSELGEGLESLLSLRHQDITGIINGLDDMTYNPATDFHIPVTYRHQPERKRENKIRLQEQVGLRQREHTPLLSVVSRLVEEKGLPLLCSLIHELMDVEDVQVVILGSGDHHFEHQFEQLSNEFPGRIAFYKGFSEEMARFIYAASDFFLMPSQFEPCGLSQLIALRYETVPIVRETGGLIDTISSFNEHTGEGNGLSFTNYNRDDFLYTIRRGLWLYREEHLWNRLMNNIYQSQFNWDHSAKEYTNIYQKAVHKGAWREAYE